MVKVKEKYLKTKSRLTDFQEVGCGGINWTELAQDTDRWWSLVNAVMNLHVP
jgi:hypothetical protein